MYNNGVRIYNQSLGHENVQFDKPQGIYIAPDKTNEFDYKKQFQQTVYIPDGSYSEEQLKNKADEIIKFFEMIKEMQDYGIEFGAHTFNHPKLNTLSNEEIEHQIIDVKKPLEEKIGREIITFAYPYGILNDYAKEMAKKAGYTFALATDSGSVCLSDDLYQIRRIAIFPNTNLFSFKRKVAGNYNFIKIKREEKNRSKK